MLKQLLLDLFDDLVAPPPKRRPAAPRGADLGTAQVDPPAASRPAAPRGADLGTAHADPPTASRPAAPSGRAPDAIHPPAPRPASPVAAVVPSPTRAAWLARSRETLVARFAALGFAALGEIRTHANQRTMVSAARGVVRLHAGYATAPDRVLIAIGRFLERRTPRAVRLEARRILLEFPAQQQMPDALRLGETLRRRHRAAEPVRPADRRLVQLLRERHALLNARHFDGQLTEIPLVVSGRMRRKLGHVALEGGRAVELAMSRRHLVKDPEDAWMETLLHEMVHQWQAETGRPVDHGAEFRRKAMQLGITPRAVRPA